MNWRRTRYGEFADDAQLGLHMSLDADIGTLSAEEFRRGEAQGAGDSELISRPGSNSRDGLINAYDVASPEWSDEFLAAVQSKMTALTKGDIDRLSSHLTEAPSVQAERLNERVQDLWQRLGKRVIEVQAARAGVTEQATSQPTSE